MYNISVEDEKNKIERRKRHDALSFMWLTNRNRIWWSTGVNWPINKQNTSYAFKVLSAIVFGGVIVGLLPFGKFSWIGWAFAFWFFIPWLRTGLHYYKSKRGSADKSKQ